MTTSKLPPLPVELQPVSSKPFAPVSQALPESLAVDPSEEGYVYAASEDGSSTPARGLNSAALPPVDSGPAFIFLAAATVLE
jgi:hypothetical protein